MKRIEIFLHWLPLYFIVALMIGSFLGEEALPISSFGHTLLEIGILVLFGLIINAWISNHEGNFIVSNDYLKDLEMNSGKNKTTAVYLEEKND